jgi:hypothetical protein
VTAGGVRGENCGRRVPRPVENGARACFPQAFLNCELVGGGMLDGMLGSSQQFSSPTVSELNCGGSRFARPALPVDGSRKPMETMQPPSCILAG